jgi:tetratricopeptide (TPR) repeat protein
MGRRRAAQAFLAIVGTVAAGVPSTASAAEHHGGHALGRVDFPITCSEKAQAEFAHGIALLHHMTYPQAREAFERAAHADPNCAMAHWGIAMTLFQPLWPTRPRLPALQRGWEAVTKAKSLRTSSPRDRALIAAAEAFFRDPNSTDYWLRIRRWEKAMAQAYASRPNDFEIAAFYALAHLAVAPADKISREHSDRSAAILLRLYKQNPDHPGVMHYLVHANDVPGRERESMEITRKYESLAPRNPHALHMPTHIYTRVGDWDGVIRGNLQAAEAALEHPAGEKGEFVWDEFAHAIEYLVYAYLQKGADEDAAAQVKRLHSTAALEPSFKTAFHLSSTQARHALERRAWGEAAALVPREPESLEWDLFPWPEAITHFARGLGAAHLGKLSDARAASNRMGELEGTTRKAGEELFARNIRILQLQLDGSIAAVEGKKEAAVSLLRQAADLETSTPKHAVTPGPTLPAHETLGDLLMKYGRPSEALAAYRRAVELYPRRLAAVLGAARAAHALGSKEVARGYYQEATEIAGDGTRPALQEARTYLSNSD